VERRLVKLGAQVPMSGQDPKAWLRQALGDLGARRLRHRGNHRYVFALGRNRRERDQVRIAAPPGTRYPKDPDEEPSQAY